MTTFLFSMLGGCGVAEGEIWPANAEDRATICDPARHALPGASGALPSFVSPLCRAAETARVADPPDAERIGLAYRCGAELRGVLAGMEEIGRPVVLGRDHTVVLPRVGEDARVLIQSVSTCIEDGCGELEWPGARTGSSIGDLTFAQGAVGDRVLWLAWNPGPDGGCERMMVFPDAPVVRREPPARISTR